MADLIYYKSDDITGQSQSVMAVARKKFPSATIVDTIEKDNTAMAALVSGLTDDTYDNIVLCMAIVDVHAEGKFTGAQAADLIPKLVTANQGTDVTGTAQANSDKELIKLASADTGEDDEYNQMLIETSGGVTAVVRLITDYVESTKLATVSDTGTAITTTETYTIYTTTYLHLLGETHSSRLPAYLAWANLYPSDGQTPLVIAYVGGGDSLFEMNNVTADSFTADTLVDTAAFVSGAYDDEDYYVAIISSDVAREGGQIKKIASNTADALTLEEDWDVTPTGTVVYAIVDRNVRTLWDVYLKYAIATYFYGTDDVDVANWVKLIDTQDQEMIEDYVERGKRVAEAVWNGIVS